MLRRAFRRQFPGLESCLQASFRSAFAMTPTPATPRKANPDGVQRRVDTPVGNRHRGIIGAKKTVIQGKIAGGIRWRMHSLCLAPSRRGSHRTNSPQGFVSPAARTNWMVPSLTRCVQGVEDSTPSE